ncbi:MAG TPA: hypothetical protein VMQ81_04500, partial [Acidimicrobiia bacterium]|nr:hypothetical protein [Acidimicrobiia bacterium]
QDRNLGPAEAASVCDFLTMHGYPIYAAWADGPTDEHLLGFLTEITRWLGGGADVMFSEFGLPTYRVEQHPGGRPGDLLVDEECAARYTDRALHALRAAGATGAMLWCDSDYDAAIWHDPPLDHAAHERTFGLWRADGSPKPSVSAVSAHVGQDRVVAADDRRWIDIDPTELHVDVGSHLPRLYSRYRAALSATPAIG